jgi:hypothetical protein
MTTKVAKVTGHWDFDKCQFKCDNPLDVEYPKLRNSKVNETPWASEGNWEPGHDILPR